MAPGHGDGSSKVKSQVDAVNILQSGSPRCCDRMTADMESVSTTVPALSTPHGITSVKAQPKRTSHVIHESSVKSTNLTRAMQSYTSAIANSVGARPARQPNRTWKFRDWPIAQSIKQCQPIPFLSRPLPRTNSGPLTVSRSTWYFSENRASSVPPSPVLGCAVFVRAGVAEQHACSSGHRLLPTMIISEKN